MIATTYFYPKLTFKNSEDEFKKICMSFGSHDKKSNTCNFQEKNYSTHRLLKN